MTMTNTTIANRVADGMMTTRIARKGPPADAYTGLSLLTLVALLAAATFFYLDAQAVAEQPLQPPSVTIPALAQEAVATKP